MPKLARIASLFLAAAIGLYLGDFLGSLPLDALPYEYWCSTQFERSFHRFVVGVFTTTFVLLAAKFTRISELLALVIVTASSIVLPIMGMGIVGETVFSFSGLQTILYFQASYFVGMLAVLGLLFIARMALPMRRQIDDT
jgi:hypothetical protein